MKKLFKRMVLAVVKDYIDEADRANIRDYVNISESYCDYRTFNNQRSEGHKMDILKLLDRVEGFEKYFNVSWFEETEHRKGYKALGLPKHDVLKTVVDQTKPMRRKLGRPRKIPFPSDLIKSKKLKVKSL